MLGTQNLVGVLINLLIGGIILYGIYLFLGMLALPASLKTIVLLVVAVFALLFLGRTFGVV